MAPVSAGYCGLKAALLLAEVAGIRKLGQNVVPEKSISQLIESITSQEDIEGITILGGEPFQQLDGIAELIKSVKQLGLTVMLYTGYEKAEFNDLMWQCFNYFRLGYRRPLSQ